LITEALAGQPVVTLVVSACALESDGTNCSAAVHSVARRLERICEANRCSLFWCDSAGPTASAIFVDPYHTEVACSNGCTALCATAAIPLPGASTAPQPAEGVPSVGARATFRWLDLPSVLPRPDLMAFLYPDGSIHGKLAVRTGTSGKASSAIMVWDGESGEPDHTASTSCFDHVAPSVQSSVAESLEACHLRAGSLLGLSNVGALGLWRRESPEGSSWTFSRLFESRLSRKVRLFARNHLTGGLAICTDGPDARIALCKFSHNGIAIPLNSLVALINS
jgi:hypothetical protein